MFDAHAHLQDPRLSGAADFLLARSVEAGITGVGCCGTSPEDWEGVARWAGRALPFRLVPAFGIHPWFVESAPPDWEKRLSDRLDTHPEAVIGEIGLDGLRREISREIQERILIRHLEIAAERGLPVVLHGARAWERMLVLLRPFIPALPSLLLHGFGGSAEVLGQYRRMDAYFSIAGSVCNPLAKRVRAAVPLIPEGRLLVETDSPDLFPRGGDPVEGGSVPLNQPANLRLIIREVAALRGATEREIEALTARNAERFFRSRPSRNRTVPLSSDTPSDGKSGRNPS